MMENENSPNKNKRKAVLVLIGVCMLGAVIHSNSVLFSSFYVKHLLNRGLCQAFKIASFSLTQEQRNYDTAEYLINSLHLQYFLRNPKN